MYASIDFATKSDFRRAVQNNLPVMLYSPSLGIPAINGEVTVEGPWPKTLSPANLVFGPQEKYRRAISKEWTARVRVQDMRVLEVH